MSDKLQRVLTVNQILRGIREVSTPVENIGWTDAARVGARAARAEGIGSGMHPKVATVTGEVTKALLHSVTAKQSGSKSDHALAHTSTLLASRLTAKLAHSQGLGVEDHERPQLLNLSKNLAKESRAHHQAAGGYKIS